VLDPPQLVAAWLGVEAMSFFMEAEDMSFLIEAEAYVTFC